MLKKCIFGGQDDVIGPKWWKIFEKIFFVNNLLGIEDRTRKKRKLGNFGEASNENLEKENLRKQVEN